MGSKRRVAKHILQIMLKERKPGQYWVEPFVGGANMIDKVDGPRIGADIHPYLIHLLKAVQSGWVPPTVVTEEMYKQAMQDMTSYAPHLTAFILFCCSFGGKWRGGYARIPKCGTNYARRGSSHLLKQSKSLSGIEFTNCDYRDIHLPPCSLIYCDPPYRGVTVYKGVCKFDSDLFWQWCRDKSAEGHTVFVSEYNAPDDFVCIAEVPMIFRLSGIETKKSVEKLFTLRRR